MPDNINPRPIAVTLGDPAGVGPEVTARAWAARHENALPSFVAVGDIASIAAVWPGPTQRVGDIRIEQGFDDGIGFRRLGSGWCGGFGGGRGAMLLQQQRTHQQGAHSQRREHDGVLAELEQAVGEFVAKLARQDRKNRIPFGPVAGQGAHLVKPTVPQPCEDAARRDPEFGEIRAGQQVLAQRYRWLRHSSHEAARSCLRDWFRHSWWRR